VLLKKGLDAWLLDAAPDVRTQLAISNITPRIRAILPTHAHAGHIAGLLAFGKEGPYLETELWATPTLLNALQRNQPWAQLFPRIRPRPVRPGTQVASGTMTFRTHPIKHRREVSDTVAIEAVDGARRLVYLPDTDAVDDAVWAATASLKDGDVLLFDGTFWGNPAELPGRDMASIPHPPVKRSIKQLAPLRKRGVRVVFTHINHSNPLNRASSRERRALTAAGFELASDGDVFP
jgi:pyrroloquinoline quinone biosynthesis protein B